MKKALCIIFSALLVFAAAFAGCGVFAGNDGRDGQDLNIYDIYEATNAVRAEDGLPQLSFDEFIREYLNYDFEYSDDKNLQTVINRSLLSSVSIFASFGGFSSDKTYAGSGVIVDLDKDAGDAYILTNAHIVFHKNASPQTAKSIVVSLYGNDYNLSDTRADDVRIVNYSLTYDVALLQVRNSEIIKGSDARAAVFAESDDVYVGARVFTVGNPEGLGVSATTGIISKESEYIALDFASASGEAILYRVIRTDAGINGGNSGGALYDDSGRIVGLINSKDAKEENENLGYALCGSFVKRLYKLMADGYKSTSGSYGIRRAVLPDDVYGYTSRAYFNNETGLTEIKDSVYILKDFGGLKKGDTVTHLKIVDGNGAAVEDLDVNRVYNMDDPLISARQGYKIIYTVSRGGSETMVTFLASFENVA